MSYEKDNRINGPQRLAPLSTFMCSHHTYVHGSHPGQSLAALLPKPFLYGVKDLLEIPSDL